MPPSTPARPGSTPRAAPTWSTLLLLTVWGFAISPYIVVFLADGCAHG